MSMRGWKPVLLAALLLPCTLALARLRLRGGGQGAAQAGARRRAARLPNCRVDGPRDLVVPVRRVASVTACPPVRPQWPRLTPKRCCRGLTATS